MEKMGKKILRWDFGICDPCGALPAWDIPEFQDEIPGFWEFFGDGDANICIDN